MSKEPKVSVIIPIYNTAEYLPRCLDSILNNTYRNLEVICVNDGSTDNSAAIIEQYSAADDRIIAIDQANAGVSAARNNGLDRATGGFIAFIDSDDWVHPQYFEVLMHFSHAENACVVASHFCTVCRPSNDSTVLYHPGDMERKLLPLDSVIGDQFLKRMVWGRVYSKDMVCSVRFDTKLAWGEDTVFNLSVILNAQNLRFVKIDAPLYFYSRRDTSLSRTVSHDSRFSLPKWYLSNFKRFENTFAKKTILEQACKETLSSRYLEMFNPEKEAVSSLLVN